MKRRQFVAALAGLVALHRAAAAAPADPVKIDKIVLKPDEWKKRLSPVQYAVLPRKARNAPAPPAGSREAQGHLRVRRLRPASLHLRDKYDSGTGWPSFFTFIPDRLATRTDFKLILPRPSTTAPAAAATRATSSTTAQAHGQALLQQRRRPQVHPVLKNGDGSREPSPITRRGQACR